MVSGTSEDGGDDGGQQAASVDGQVEDGEEGASLLLLLDVAKKQGCIFSHDYFLPH